MSAIFAFSTEIENENDICPILLRDRMQSLHPQLNNVYLNRSNNYNCITFTGQLAQVLSAKADLLKIQPIKETLLIDTLYPGLAYRKLARTKLHEKLEEIALNRDIQIIIDYNDLSLSLIGPICNVEFARIDVLLYFDHLLGLIVNTIKLPLRTIKHAELNTIMENTKTNIYFPSPWSNTNDEDKFIHVTGDTSDDVQRATSLLNKLLSQKIKRACGSHSIINLQKRDWILLYKRKELKKIMQDNGSFISFGFENQQIQVYAETKINVERTLRSLNHLTSQIFQAVIYVNTLQSTDLVTLLSQESGALVIYRTDLNQFVIIGSKQQIHKAIQMMCGLPLSQEHHRSITFSIELAEDQKEFISGKKNGKINKIMKSSNAKILFKPFNTFNFIITIESDDFFKAKDGLESLQNELPAELSFFVPEICHRRIIGVAGKNIQRVMKQYGVYVKFLSHEELVEYGGYLPNQHNVVARTPEKNVESLEKLKAAVMEFITFQKDRDFVTRQEYVPYYVQRNMVRLERLYNCCIGWPERDGTNHVFVTGPQSHIQEMQARIKTYVPQYMELQVPASVVLEKLINSSEIEDLQQTIYKTTRIFLILPENLILTQSHHVSALKIEGFNMVVTMSDVKVKFKFCFDSSTKSRVAVARQLFDKFMQDRFVPFDKHNSLRSSPSIEYLRHISPSVLHHIDHPESYEKNVTNDLQKMTLRSKISPEPSYSLDLFSKSPNNHFNPWTPPRISQPRPSRSNVVSKSFYPQPKPTISTSAISNNDRLFGSFMHSNESAFQFPPTGYSRQRSISLIPTEQSTFQQNVQSPVSPSFGYLGPYYPRYNTFEEMIPSSSVSTPIPVNDKKTPFRNNDRK